MSSSPASPVTDGGGAEDWTFWSLTAVIATRVVEFIVSFGVVLVFLPQYLKIRKTRNAEGFSLYTCLALITAGLLRITFWFGHPFDIPLLLQAVTLVLIIMAIVHIITVVKASNRKNEEKRTLFDLNLRHFWDWTDFTSYAITVVLFSLTCGVLMYLLKSYAIFVETVGFVALMIEAVLNVPQVHRNWRRKSTEGLSMLTFGQMFVGDLVRNIYFVARHTPPQFWICGSLQVALDLVIWFQMWLYRSSSSYSPPRVDADDAEGSHAPLTIAEEARRVFLTDEGESDSSSTTEPLEDP